MKASKVILIGTGRLACACLESCLDRKAISSFFLACTSPTLVVSAYNSFLFPAAVLASPWLNIVNFHNSLLPRHRGRNAPTWTIFEMDSATGITWHQVSPQVDEGDIICQRELDVPADISAILLTQKTLDLGAQAFRDILPSLLEGTYTSRPVGHHEDGTLHRSADVPNHGVLDLAWDLSKAHAFLRSLDYGKARVFPPAQVPLLGWRFSVLSYSVETEYTTPSRGIGVEARNDELVLRDGGRRLTIHLCPS